MYNAYVKGELYEIDLWTKLRKNQRMNWFSNETIDIKLKVEKTIYYREKIIPKQTSKWRSPMQEEVENWLNRDIYEIRRNHA